jgi:hypothetical protein
MEAKLRLDGIGHEDLVVNDPGLIMAREQEPSID